MRQFARIVGRALVSLCLFLPPLLMGAVSAQADRGADGPTLRAASFNHAFPPHFKCSRLKDAAEEDDSDHLGSTHEDLIECSDDTDIIHAQGGDDVVFGLDGSDLLCGGKGDDLVLGGRGNDFTNGGSGSDALFGGRGDDRLEGGDGDDFLVGGPGYDLCIGGEARTFSTTAARCVSAVTRIATRTTTTTGTTGASGITSTSSVTSTTTRTVTTTTPSAGGTRTVAEPMAGARTAMAAATTSRNHRTGRASGFPLPCGRRVRPASSPPRPRPRRFLPLTRVMVAVGDRAATISAAVCRASSGRCATRASGLQAHPAPPDHPLPLVTTLDHLPLRVTTPARATTTPARATTTPATVRTAPATVRTSRQRSGRPRQRPAGPAPELRSGSSGRAAPGRAPQPWWGQQQRR
jgi:hemolysin type calcium-binding protein